MPHTTDIHTLSLPLNNGGGCGGGSSCDPNDDKEGG